MAPEDEGDLPAGAFSTWLAAMQAALRGERASDVPCGGCTACCRSSQFVHIGPDEEDTLAHIPPALLFPAPRLPRGHVVLGYDERGHCPMLVADGCSIYEHRPRACRTYDCRVFPAAGVEVAEGGGGGGSKADVSRRARRWRFDHPTPADRTEHDAVRSAAAFLGEQDVLPEGTGQLDATRRAVLAVEVHELFLGGEPDPEAVRVEVVRRRRPG